MAPSPAPFFFFSYARKNASPALDRFFDDLSTALGTFLGRPPAQAGFRDVTDIDLAQAWPEVLADALATCRCFVAVYSPQLFASPACGKEWSAFRARFEAQEPDSPGTLPLLFPVLWTPPDDTLWPACARVPQASHAAQPALYRRFGLAFLLAQGREEDYGRFVGDLAARLFAAAREHELAPHPTRYSFADQPDAFEAPSDPPPPPPRGRLAAYLEEVWSALQSLHLLGVGKAGGDRDVPLPAVYTALDVTARVRLPAPGRRGPAGGDGVSLGLPLESEYGGALLRRVAAEARRGGEGRGRPGVAGERPEAGFERELTAVEAAAGLPRLVLLGAPGGGKSTFARYLALCLAGERLRREAADLGTLNGLPPGRRPGERATLAWPHGAPVPLFAGLRGFVASPAFPAPGVAGTAGHLFDYLFGPKSLAGAELEGELRDHLRRPGGGLLILDGLDEIPHPEANRERLRQVIAAFVACCPACRVLVTSRPYAYLPPPQQAAEKPRSPWRLDEAGFGVATLAPFDDRAVEAFVRAWYGHLAARGELSGPLAADRAAGLLGEIRRQAHLRPLAERPLLLTMMTDLHASAGGVLRGGRAALYEESTNLLLDRWNKKDDKPGVETLADQLGLGVGEVREALEKLALAVHAARGEAPEAAAIPAQEVVSLLCGGELAPGGEGERREERPREDETARPATGEGGARKGVGKPRDRRIAPYKILDLLDQRSGILLADRPGQVRFPHRSYQEYLAACRLLKTDNPPEEIARRVIADPGRWREVFLLAAAKAAETPYLIWPLLGTLVPAAPPGGTSPADRRLLHAFLAGLAVRESKLLQPSPAYRHTLEQVRRGLARILELGAFSPVERAEAGRVLGALGDPRDGVGLGEDGLPRVAPVEVSGGRFLMGSRRGEEDSYDDERPQHEEEVRGFWIARYAVTNAQYRVFAADGGYTPRWRHCWTRAGWEWKGKAAGPGEALPEEPYKLDNHPRVNVTWYEAWAFSRWLGERLGIEVRLPSEAEWEKAARGTGGRKYPWGEEDDADRRNGLGTGIGTTTAVGSFPRGESPCGALDMSGNVWEWCGTKGRENYRKPVDEDPEGTAARVVRGGSFLNGPRYLRCAYRDRWFPDDRYRILGFRVVAPVPF